MIRCYIGLGSNLQNPAAQLKQALAALTALEDCRLIDCSPIYQSRAIGPGSQPDYLNAVVALDTHLPAEHLLGRLQAIESRQGRVRIIRWGARTLDLDILLYGNQSIATERLKVPHPGLTERAFVLYPLADLAPDLQLPGGRPISEYLQCCDASDLIRLDLDATGVSL